MNVPPFSPGCFGSAFGFKADDSICKGCVFAEECLPAATVARSHLRAYFGIETADVRQANAVAKRAAAAALLVENQNKDPATLALPQKTRALVGKLDQGNYQVKTNLANGINPFGAAMPFMRIVCQLLMKYPKAIDRQMLSTMFVRHLGWKDGTADAHARMAIQALTHIGAVDNQDGSITLRRLLKS